MPSGGEPLLPSRPTKLSGGDSPAKFSWYHANLDRKRAEAMLRKYGKVRPEYWRTRSYALVGVKVQSDVMQCSGTSLYYSSAYDNKLKNDLTMCPAI